MRFFITCLLLWGALLMPSVDAADQNYAKRVKKYLLDKGADLEVIDFSTEVVIRQSGEVTEIIHWGVPGIVEPTGQDLPLDAELPIVDLPKRYIKIVGGKAVEKTQGEKDAADDIYKDGFDDIGIWVDPYVSALAAVLQEELGLNDKQMKAKIKAKLDLDKIKKIKRTSKE